MRVCSSYEVVKDSPAAKAGVKVHDILLELDGKPLSDPGKLVEFVQSNGEKTDRLRDYSARGDERWDSRSDARATKDQGSRGAREPGELLLFPSTGAVLTEPLQAQEHARPTGLCPQHGFGERSGISQLVDATNLKPAEDANTAVAKRLDALDAEIKQLRKAVEGIGKAEKAIEELNKAIEA